MHFNDYRPLIYLYVRAACIKFFIIQLSNICFNQLESVITEVRQG